MALKPGKHWVILDFRLPTNKLAFLAPLAAGIMKPFGVTLDLAERHPWESIWRHMHSLSMRDLYGGFAYIAIGTKEDKGQQEWEESLLDDYWHVGVHNENKGE